MIHEGKQRQVVYLIQIYLPETASVQLLDKYY